MFEGNWVALVTPFKDGKIDRKSFKNLIEWVIQNGVQGIVPCGTTGESATLTYEEHKEVIELAMEYAEGKVKVMAGTGSNSTREAVELTKHAEKVGVNAVLLIAPYYNKPTQKGLFEHFSRIAEECSVPQFIYNIPSRTGVNVSAEVVIELSHKHKNIKGIKEASGNLVQISKIVRDARDDFVVLSGDDALTLPILSVGGKGVISATANLVPDKMTELVVSFLEGNFQKSLKIHQELLDVFQTLFLETNPIPVKTALYLAGIIDSPELRLPLVPPSESTLQKIKEMLRKLGMLKRE